jgi:hypothetical protein
MGTLFPQLSGDTLITQLQAKFSPDRPAKGYGAARDQMFSGIDNVDGTVTGVYTGIQISLDANSAPPLELKRLSSNFRQNIPGPKVRVQIDRVPKAICIIFSPPKQRLIMSVQIIHLATFQTPLQNVGIVKPGFFLPLQ